MFRFLFTGDPGMTVFALLGLFLFLLLFLGVTLWAIFGSKSYMTRMANLPLEAAQTKNIID